MHNSRSRERSAKLHSRRRPVVSGLPFLQLSIRNTDVSGGLPSEMRGHIQAFCVKKRRVKSAREGKLEKGISVKVSMDQHLEG
jgi:hypothetical protein